MAGDLNLPGSAPQDIKLDPAGRIFYVADKSHGGVWLIDAATFRVAGFIPTGPDAHGLYPSRDARYLYVTNRGNGTITLISFATRKIVTTWRIPGGGSPDMGNLSPDGKVFWVSGRYDNARLRHLHRQRPTCWPGSRWGHSHTGYASGLSRAGTPWAIPG